MVENVEPERLQTLDAVIDWLFSVEPRAEVRKYVVNRALAGRGFDHPDELKRGIVSTWHTIDPKEILG